MVIDVAGSLLSPPSGPKLGREDGADEFLRNIGIYVYLQIETALSHKTRVFRSLLICTGAELKSFDQYV